MAENKLFQDSSEEGQPDLSDEGLKNILDGVEGDEAESEADKEGSEEAPESEDTPDETGEETPQDEDSPESGEGEGSSEDEEYILPGKAKTPEAVREIHKNDQRYIRDLETKLKSLKNQASDYVDIGDDGTVKPKQQELTPEQREKINDRLRDKMEENPAETIYNIAFSVANEMVSPLRQQLDQAQQKRTLSNKVGDGNQEIATKAEKILKDYPALQKMENGADMAVRMAKGENLEKFAKAAYQRGLKDSKGNEKEETGATPKGGTGGKSKTGEGGGSVEDKVHEAIFKEAASSKFKALE